ncbi:MAG: hypothetical protein GC160_28430 [Acidobacteria bacterium]|nr:hypothetical protein [Acidobacteriota bacterium]
MSLVLDFLIPEADLAEVYPEARRARAIPTQAERIQSGPGNAQPPAVQIGPPQGETPRLTPELWTDFFQVL